MIRYVVVAAFKLSPGQKIQLLLSVLSLSKRERSRLTTDSAESLQQHIVKVVHSLLVARVQLDAVAGRANVAGMYFSARSI